MSISQESTIMNYANLSHMKFVKDCCIGIFRKIGDRGDGTVLASREGELRIPGKSAETVHVIVTVPQEAMGGILDDVRDTELSALLAIEGVTPVALMARDYDDNYVPPQHFAQISIDAIQAECATVSRGVDIDALDADFKDSIFHGRIFIGTMVEMAQLRIGGEGFTTFPDGSLRPLKVLDIRRNGADHYLLTVDSWNDSFSDYHQVSLGHVTRIVSQPEGRRVRGNLLRGYIDRGGKQSIGHSKTQYALSQSAWRDWAQTLQPTSMINFDAMVSKMWEAGLVKRENNDDGWWGYTSVGSKKKMRAWIKRNINRFLMNPAAEQKNDDDAESAMMSRDMDFMDY